MTAMDPPLASPAPLTNQMLRGQGEASRAGNILATLAQMRSLPSQDITALPDFSLAGSTGHIGPLELHALIHCLEVHTVHAFIQ